MAHSVIHVHPTTLQTNQVAFNKNQVDLMCILCKSSVETLSHFLLGCEILDSVRQPILRNIKYCLKDSSINLSHQETFNTTNHNRLTAVVDHKIVP